VRTHIFKVIFLVLLLPVAATGERLDLDATLVTSGGYDDNILFNRVDPVSDYLFRAKPSLEATLSSEKSEIGMYGYVEFLRYLKEKDLDVENYRYEISGMHQYSPRFSMEGTGFFLKDTTLDSELEETGRVVARENREQISGSAAASYLLNPVSRAGLDYTFTKTDYDSRQWVSRETHSFDFNYERWFNERVDALLVLPTINTTTTEEDKKIDYYRLSLGWTHAFSQTLRVRNVLGYGFTRISGQGENSETQAGNANLSLTQSSETLRLVLGLTSDARVDARGDLYEVDRVFMNLRKKVSERFSLLLYGSYYITRPLDIYDKIDRSYYVVKPALTYNITPTHAIILSYKHEKEHDQTLSENRDRERNILELLLDLNFIGF